MAQRLVRAAPLCHPKWALRVSSRRFVIPPYPASHVNSCNGFHRSDINTIDGAWRTKSRLTTTYIVTVSRTSRPIDPPSPTPGPPSRDAKRCSAFACIRGASLVDTKQPAQLTSEAGADRKQNSTGASGSSP